MIKFSHRWTCLGIMIVIKFLCFFLSIKCAFPAKISSVLWVLAATHIFNCLNNIDRSLSTFLFRVLLFSIYLIFPIVCLTMLNLIHKSQLINSDLTLLFTIWFFNMRYINHRFICVKLEFYINRHICIIIFRVGSCFYQTNQES